MKTPPQIDTKNELKSFLVSDTEELKNVINYIKENPAHIEIISTDKAVKQRIIDVLCGACTALSLGICLIDKRNILIIKK